MYYYDEFGKEFEDELSFHEYLEEIDEREIGRAHV